MYREEKIELLLHVARIDSSISSSCGAASFHQSQFARVLAREAGTGCEPFRPNNSSRPGTCRHSTESLLLLIGDRGFTSGGESDSESAIGCVPVDVSIELHDDLGCDYDVASWPSTIVTALRSSWAHKLLFFGGGILPLFGF